MASLRSFLVIGELIMVILSALFILSSNNSGVVSVNNSVTKISNINNSSSNTRNAQNTGTGTGTTEITTNINKVLNVTPIPNGTEIRLKIVNFQDSFTPSPFQVEITLTRNELGSVVFNHVVADPLSALFYEPGVGNLYAWLENYTGNYMVWWVKLPQAIPPSSAVTIYINLSRVNNYPFTGMSPEVENALGIHGYDNGGKVFLAYGYFNDTTDGWKAYNTSDQFVPQPSPDGIEMLNNQGDQGTYILPPVNFSLMPVVIEEAWYESSGADANTINLFGNGTVIGATGPGGTDGGGTPATGIFAQFEYYSNQLFLKSAYTNSILSQTSFVSSAYTLYSYMIVSPNQVTAGYYEYSPNQVWVPLTMLGSLLSSGNTSSAPGFPLNSTSARLAGPSLMIGAGSGDSTSYQYVEWVIARAYPPNGMMPVLENISIQSV
ncbi:hypothetical protein [Metallosphaera javensis (ex Sakai et al. 2022)]|uniref:hypothetical protein n=1 Tax=Metallosphaera javensis (ex Sakai et al. 2022) TaxID=2775498 RepID=UPI002585CCB6|nr:MAG: hypothetical protein MjAS7_2028 [Metallosphaera javensis (ex Sakai et al. 2022)]